MLTIDGQIKADMEKLEQLEHRKRLRNNKAKKDKERMDERRKFIVGRIFLDAFPEFMNLQPKNSVEENDLEFAPLVNFLTTLSARIRRKSNLAEREPRKSKTISLENSERVNSALMNQVQDNEFGLEGDQL